MEREWKVGGGDVGVMAKLGCGEGWRGGSGRGVERWGCGRGWWGGIEGAWRESGEVAREGSLV